MPQSGRKGSGLRLLARTNALELSANGLSVEASKEISSAMAGRQETTERETAPNIGDWHLRASARKHRGYSVIAQVALVIGLCMASFAASAQPLSCPTGQSVCAGSCVNTTTDFRNCGSCGTACTVGQVCTAGQCVTTSCPAGQGLCAGTCMNITTDPQNCGSCGHICATGQACTAGQCMTTSCPAGQGLCAGGCVNITTDPQNCGRCGNICAIGQACTAGQCSQAGSTGGDVFACEFTVGKLAGNTIVPTGIKLTGPAGQPCSNNYGSTGVQVIAPFACAFSVGKLAGDTIVPTGISLTGPAGATCTDNYGSSGTQVPAQN